MAARKGQKKRNTIYDVLERLVICEPSTLPTGCWEWPLARQRGYGVTSVGDGRVKRVHRVVYEHFVGKIPDDMEPDHECRNRACANFEHLVLRTRAEHRTRHTELKTHCKNGHPLSGDNLVVLKRQRGCRTCRTEALRRRYARKKEQRE